MSDLEDISNDCKSLFGLRAIAFVLSGENFFYGGIRVGYGVIRSYLSSFGFNCNTLWLFSDTHGSAVAQKVVRPGKV